MALLFLDITWETCSQPDGGAYRQICVTDEADWGLFNWLAVLLEKELDGEWVEKLDGVEQRYWDLEAGEGKITLHYEEYLGLMVNPTQLAEASPESLDLMEKAYWVLQDAKGSGKKRTSRWEGFLQNLKIMFFGRPK